MPLLIVTRPRAQATGWVEALRAAGLQAQALPLIEITPIADAQPVQAAWAQIERYALVVFVSANAVTRFFALSPAQAEWPATLLAGSTGPGTSAALLAAGVPRAALVEPPADAARFDSEALWSQLAAQSWSGKRALVVCGEDGRDWLADTLAAHGASVDFIAAYARRPPRLDGTEQALLDQAVADPSAHLWLFSSSQAVGHLQVLVPAADWSRSQAIASHPRIAQAAVQAGFGRVEVVAPTLQALAERAAGWPGDSRPLQSAPS